MKANRKFTRDEDAVSPVIGVILMVAITVILAAIIAPFVFSMGSSLSRHYIVACTVSQISSEKIDITYVGGPDADALGYLSVTVTPGDPGNTTDITRTLGSLTDSTDNPSVGATIAVPGDTGQFAQMDHVVIVATFLDGTKQVILEKYL
ncbi:MAG: type IV pilin N-terminal domain-containing protein [Gammaproteobacteria bacterium]|nr:type IV pilin N-terminal domain-containing protein [Methanosarcinales archaeon]MCK5643918.1 type IV pilin N-terminal domain-containing protein [Gammaproteobacteria bacterium]